MWTKGNQAANTVVVNKDDYGKYAQDKTDILFTGDQIDTDENEIVAGNSLINRRGFIGSDIGSHGAMQLLKDKIIFSKDNWATFFTMLSGNGLYLETENGLSRVVLTPEFGFQIDKWNTVSEDWDNILYIDSDNGNYHVDNGFIELNSPYNQIKIDPAVGIIVYNTTTDPYKEVFKLDTNGNVFMQDATVQGVFKTGTTGQARIEIDANGIKSYNSSNNQFGLFIDPSSSMVDMILYNNTNKVFRIYDGITDTTLMLYNNDVFSYNRSSNILYMLNKWDFSNSTSVSGLNTDSSGSHGHGITNGTKLAVVDDALNITGYITFSADGTHYHNVKKV
jgi:hypothetical protein